MGKGNSFRSTHAIPGTYEVGGVWTGGTTGDCTLTSGDWSRGIASIVRTDTGKYTITFNDFGQQIVGFSFSVILATGVNAQRGNLVLATYSSSAGTVDMEVNAADGSTLADIPTTSKFFISVKFASNAPDT